MRKMILLLSFIAASPALADYQSICGSISGMQASRGLAFNVTSEDAKVVRFIVYESKNKEMASLVLTAFQASNRVCVKFGVTQDGDQYYTQPESISIGKGPFADF